MNPVPEGQNSLPARKVFISYRREDSAAYAGRLYDAMVTRFGDRNVFMDLELAPGVDFVERITEAVGACQVLIEVMGPTWATVKNEEGRTRIADPEDFVRLELEIALRRPDVTVIPVLVSGARMPDRRDLPPELGAITRRNALELSDLRWRYDVGRLITALEELLAAETTIQETVPASPHDRGASAVRPALTDEASGDVTAPPAERDVADTPEAPTVHASPRRSLWRWALAGALTLAAAAAIAVGALGGGSSDSSPGGIAFTPYTASTFTVDVPAGWPTDEEEEPLGQKIRTSLEDPAQQMRVDVTQELPLPAADRANDARTEHEDDPGYGSAEISSETVDSRATTLFGYEVDEPSLGGQPSTVYTYFFNAGESGWRTRAVGVKGEVSPETVLAIATRMAESLEPR